MVRFVARLAPALVLAGLVALPASRGEDVKPAGTPKEAMLRFTRALHDNDKETLLALTKANDAQKDYLVNVMAFLKAGIDFRDAFIAAYGRDDWEKFQATNEAPKDGQGSLRVSDRDKQVEKVEKATFEVKGDEAFVEFAGAGAGKRPRLVKEGGSWKLDAGSICPPDDEMKEAVEKLKPATAIVEKFAKVPGKNKADGQPIKPDDIKVELGRAMIKQSLGVDKPDIPQRFDVDKVIAEK
jgi:hypothetical protein